MSEVGEWGAAAEEGVGMAPHVGCLSRLGKLASLTALRCGCRAARGLPTFPRCYSLGACPCSLHVALPLLLDAPAHLRLRCLVARNRPSLAG